MLSREILLGAKTCVIGCAQIHEGQQVLLLDGPATDASASEALQMVAELQGADVAVMWLQQLAAGWFEQAPRIGTAAFEAADIVINNGTRVCTTWLFPRIRANWILATGPDIVTIIPGTSTSTSASIQARTPASST